MSPTPIDRLNSGAPFRKVRPVNKDVEGAVDEWLPALGLPAPPAAGVKDLAGRQVRVAKFIDDAAVRFFFRRRTLSFQQRMVKALTRRLRKRGAEIISVRPTIEDCARWCDAQGNPDTSALRFQFASAPPDLGD